MRNGKKRFCGQNGQKMVQETVAFFWALKSINLLIFYSFNLVVMPTVQTRFRHFLARYNIFIE
jgi:hypothetical protein